MFNLFKLFTTKKNIDHNIEDKDNQITISIPKNGKVKIELKVNNYSELDAETFGLMLFFMNEGYYAETIVNLLFDLTLNKEKKTIAFMEKSIDAWSTAINNFDIQPNTNIINNQDPIISPTSFYKNIRNQQ